MSDSQYNEYISAILWQLCDTETATVMRQMKSQQEHSIRICNSCNSTLPLSRFITTLYNPLLYHTQHISAILGSCMIRRQQQIKDKQEHSTRIHCNSTLPLSRFTTTLYNPLLYPTQWRQLLDHYRFLISVRFKFIALEGEPSLRRRHYHTGETLDPTAPEAVILSTSSAASDQTPVNTWDVRYYHCEETWPQ